MSRQVKFKETADVVPCPKCGNKTEFTIHSRQFSEDCCEVWAECKCGNEPADDERMEDVWGGTHDANVMGAISCWNDAMATE